MPAQRKNLRGGEGQAHQEDGRQRREVNSLPDAKTNLAVRPGARILRDENVQIGGHARKKGQYQKGGDSGRYGRRGGSGPARP